MASYGSSRALSGITEIVSNDLGYVAIKADGGIAAWRSGHLSGANNINNVAKIVGNSKSFAALKNDGTVAAWGELNGASIPTQVQNQLTNVVSITPMLYGYSALKSNGDVVTWGHSSITSGGDYGDWGEGVVVINDPLSKDIRSDPPQIDPPSATLDTGPTSGSLQFDGDGTFSYTPNENFVGDDSFSYTITNRGQSSGTTAQISVTAVNDAPVASGSSSLERINEDDTTPDGERVRSLFIDNFSDLADSTTADNTFDSGIEGWSVSNGTIGTESSTAWGNVLGRFNQQTLSKTFTLNNDSATIEFDFLRVDSWDGERFIVESGNEEILNYPFSCKDENSDEILTPFHTETKTGSTTIAGEGTYYWTIEALDYGTGSSKDIGVNSWNDQSFRITIEVPGGMNQLDLRMRDELTEGINNESWAIDNFSITPASSEAGPKGHNLAAIAITSYSRNTQQGEWQWSSDGNSWTNIPAITNASNAYIIDPEAKLRFLPAENYNGDARDLSVVLVDGSAGINYSNGDRLNVASRGGSTPYSSNQVVLSHIIDPINDAPTLSITGTQGTYNENSNNLTLLISDANVADLDSSHYSEESWMSDSTHT